MKETFKNRIFGITVTGISFLASAVFVFLIAKTGFLTWQLLLLCGVLLLGLAGLVYVLSRDTKRKVCCVISVLLALAILAVQILGSYYVLVAQSALKKITNTQKEFSEIGIYVRNDDPAEKLNDVKRYIFGILEIQDRAATDDVIKEISEKMKVTIETKCYSGIEELMDGLLVSKEIDVIIVNKSFLELLETIEGHNESFDKIREIYVVKNDTEIVIEAESENQGAIDNPYVTSVYISGIDCYGSLARKSRSDVNILAVFNTKTGQILLLSTPRDYYVPLSISNGIPDKLTHAGIYGIEVSKNTLGMLYGINVDYYFRVNFDGFKGIIDSLGGITVYSEYDFSAATYKYVKGENFLNGDQALAFVRSRYAFASGDRQRGKNQMAVIKAVINKVVSPAILVNYKTTLDSLAGAFETSVPYSQITKLIQNQLNEGTQWNIVTYSVDGKGATLKPYSLSSRAYVMIPDQTTVDHAKKLIAQVNNNEILTQ